MAVIDWPADRDGEPQSMTWGVSTPKTAWVSPYTGQVQSISYMADRLRLTLIMPPAKRRLAGGREAFLMQIASRGDWVRMYHRARPVPQGTLRGSPTVAASAIAGARTLLINCGSGSPTLVAGDMLGIGSQLVPVAIPGAVGSGGVMTVNLVLPLRVAVTSGTPVIWDRPTGTFQLTNVEPQFTYDAPGIQRALEVQMIEVFA